MEREFHVVAETGILHVQRLCYKLQANSLLI